MQKEKRNYLLEEGKYSIRVRAKFRQFLNDKKNGNQYINDLIEADYKRKGK